LAADRAAFLPLPAEPFAARRIEPVVINSLSFDRIDGNDYSVPTAFAYQSLTALGAIDRVRFHRRGTVVAEHARCWGKGQVTFEPLHYLARLERKPGGLDYARPLAGWSLPDAFVALLRRLEQANPKGGTRQHIRVLRLWETYDLAEVTAALERALALAVSDADAARLLVERARERPAAVFDLTGGGLAVSRPFREWRSRAHRPAPRLIGVGRERSEQATITRPAPAGRPAGISRAAPADMGRVARSTSGAASQQGASHDAVFYQPDSARPHRPDGHPPDRDGLPAYLSAETAGRPSRPEGAGTREFAWAHSDRPDGQHPAAPAERAGCRS
jgi:hypothetical protein